MWIINLFLISSFIPGFYLGVKPYFMLERLNRFVVLNTLLIVFAVFTLLIILYTIGLFPQSVAAPFMMVVYSTLSGFFGGYGVRLIRMRKEGGQGLYQHRSFWIDHAPNLLSIVCILFGLYRTAILTDQVITGIRVTSGLSLIGFGFLVWTLKVVPEFRSEGILLLDRLIFWDEVLSWKWVGENVIAVEYLAEKSGEDGRIREFLTSIPADEKKELETIFSSKMDEFADRRKDKLFREEDPS